MGVKGLVFGGITDSKCIDGKMVHKLMKEINTSKIDVTFHKAFDQVSNLVEAYDQLSSFGINRVLTQGGSKSIIQNLDILSQLIN